MFLARRLLSYYQDVVDTVREVLAADDPMLCDCVDDRWCVDCSLLTDVTPLAWPTASLDSPCVPLDAA